jgi:hypothetical protein
MKYKNYKVRIGMVVHTYTDVMAPSEDEAKWEVFDEFKRLEERYGDLSGCRYLFERYTDNINYAEPMTCVVTGDEIEPVLGLHLCKDYDPDAEDRRKPSERKECA